MVCTYVEMQVLSNTFFQWEALTFLMAIRATSDFYFWRCAREERNVAVLLLSVLTTSAPSSLGTLNEFSDRVTTIKQLTGDEVEEIFVKF
jgi:hypothetical protein